ncbi:MAG: nucleoside phosphorylase [Paludibacteraceae bacterium]|jgi:uridine phosphorylase|nr:nucleoside phosphorylase [Paludibacteraceae bacterium]MDI9536983.1 nucleoside phosphorylase [Bacteroidota bacterium]HHT61327.1 nucleoside phosphorylase [Bacteroidales bacterium]MBP9039004.1 nucleoside phosphorylase [Paludibacteraceae bacterium]HOA46500.1 nucleoside phosphorylase [Paludibacteraceae bacterium]
MRIIPASELIINSDGSIFHLHVKPEQIATTIILCGDPARVTLIASYFDSIECEISSREFHTITGMYKGKRLSCVSHGIGPDNIDIVVNELDALVNVDFATRTEKPEHTTLTLIRIGTSGGLQDICPVGTYVVSKYSMGFDGVLNFYEVPENFLEMDMEEAFKKHANWSPRLTAPYCVKADEELVERIGFDMVKGITIAAPGFYGPQGRYIRAKLAFPDLNSKVISFRHNGEMITNFEMESSMVAGLGKLLGHKALTVCAIIAGRVSKNMNTNYKGSIEGLIEKVLERI